MNNTLHFALSYHSLVKMLLLAVAGFGLTMALTPIYTSIAYKMGLWKQPRTTTVTGAKATVLQKLHEQKQRPPTPTMGGVVFIVAVSIVTVVANLSRSQTWLPLAAFVGAGLVGWADDIFNVRSNGQGKAGLPTKIKLLLTILVALVGGWFFYSKLGVHAIHLPGIHGSLDLGWLIVPLFVLVVVSTANAVNISDGLDGLAGGLTTTAFGAYAIIAALEHRYGVAGFCLTMVGALMSYTWFNIAPARFFMGDSGSFALGTALGVVAMLTDTVLLLPLIGLVFVAEAGSVILQLTSKKLRNGKKIFRISPVHHHFVAGGWPATKVTMRFWLVGQMAAIAGLVLFVMGWYA
jgi:phospho-N-acetylmuramoyl-pentapeptide-transferase